MYRLPILILAACTLAASPAAGQSAAQKAQGERAQQVRTYRYVYYPTQQIYYATEPQIWFWMNGSSWSYGVDLPAHYRAQMGTGLPLRLATTRPFAEHDYVEKRYGRPWREKNAAPPTGPVDDGVREAASRPKRGRDLGSESG